MTVQEQLQELTKQRNTLALIKTALQEFDLETLRLVHDNTFNLDMIRVNAIKDYLTVEKEAVETEIESLLGASVSGV